MLIGLSGGVATLPVGTGDVTLALTTPAGSVVIEQSDGAGGWFPVVYGGVAVVLDADNTMVSVYSPCKIRVTAVGTGVFLKG